MKNSIKITALLLLAGTGIFASVSAKTLNEGAKDGVTISAMASQKGIQVSVDKSAAGKSIVMIYDQDKNVLRKDVLTAAGSTEKGYVLSSLDNGDYTMEVISNNQTVKKNIHIYNEDKTKTFIIQD